MPAQPPRSNPRGASAFQQFPGRMHSSPITKPFPHARKFRFLYRNFESTGSNHRKLKFLNPRLSFGQTALALIRARIATHQPVRDSITDWSQSGSQFGVQSQFGFRFLGTMVAIHTLMMTTMSLLLLQLLLLGNFAASTSPEEDCLAIHNKIRSAEDIPPLKWSPDLATYALRYAERQRDHHQCAMVHSRGQYGENLFWGSGKAFTLSDAVHSWAKEADHYDYESNSCAPGKVCGHYTQLVWADTKKVGCAAVGCHDGATFVICSYDPPGNFVGEKPFERKIGQNRNPIREPKKDVDVGVVKSGDGGGENVKDVEAKLCQCMLSCVSKAKSKQWRDEVTAK